MRGALLAVGIAVALGATAGLAYLAMQSRGDDERDIAQTPVEVQPDPDLPDAPPAELTEEERTRLKALGYISDDE